MRRNLMVMNKRGVALIFVLLIMVVMSILSVAVFTLFTSNIAQEKMQEDAIRAHYVAMSGVDVAFGALLQNNRSLLTSYFDKALNVTVTPLSDSVTLDNGTAAIVITSYVLSSERYVLITSTGSLSNSTVNQVVKMEFRVAYPEIQKWE